MNHGDIVEQGTHEELLAKMDFIQNYTILNLKNVKNKNKKQVTKL